MNLEKVIALDEKYHMNTFGKRMPVSFERGEGIYLFTNDGVRYADFMGGIAVNALGHCNKTIKNAMHAQIDKLIHTSNLYYIEKQALLAQKLVELSCADKVFFSNSGAEANEAAIKLARLYFYNKGEGFKNEVITLNGSFHGRTLATLAATGQQKFHTPYKPLMTKFKYVAPNDIDELGKQINEKTCAVMLEVIQGEKGVFPLSDEYMSAVRELCDKNGILLIFDEVQTGMGRTGKMFGYQHFDITPDIFTLAKALGGGMPVGAICAKDFCSVFAPGDHGSTFGGNPLACAAALAVIEEIECASLVENSFEMGCYFVDRLKTVCVDKIKEVRGKGLMIGVELYSPAAPIMKKMFEKKYLCGAVDNTLRILPPLIITKSDIDGFINALAEVL
ncbi:MAG: aspartate aminotransferase family protein [Firmicutes bacterium]|nr:aspartate aminotransferase family protein [Bacillota bacterium]